jgi:hypothetical protein
VLGDTMKQTIEYNNDYINQFMDRTKTFPRESIELIKPNIIKVITDRMYEGYAWIGAAQHNTTEGCKGVDKYNYCLIDSTELYIYFKETE